MILIETKEQFEELIKDETVDVYLFLQSPNDFFNIKEPFIIDEYQSIDSLIDALYRPTKSITYANFFRSLFRTERFIL